MIPQSRSNTITFHQLLRDIDRRLLRQERRSSYGMTAAGSTLATIQTVDEITDSTVWYYVLDDELVHHAGGTMTYAAWQASLPD